MRYLQYAEWKKDSNGVSLLRLKGYSGQAGIGY